MLARITLALAFLAANVAAQQAIYGQCGGQTWTGATTCQSGLECQYQNDYYSQCLGENDHPDWLEEQEGGDEGEEEGGDEGEEEGGDEGEGEGGGDEGDEASED